MHFKFLTYVAGENMSFYQFTIVADFFNVSGHVHVKKVAHYTDPITLSSGIRIKKWYSDAIDLQRLTYNPSRS